MIKDFSNFVNETFKYTNNKDFRTKVYAISSKGSEHLSEIQKQFEELKTRIKEDERACEVLQVLASNLVSYQTCIDNKIKGVETEDSENYDYYINELFGQINDNFKEYKSLNTTEFKEQFNELEDVFDTLNKNKK